jgi:ubiquinone/menaquinone biosynthesis C-methylase UbiE
MHHHRHSAHRDHHGNPRDLEAYIERLTGPDREAWQRPDEVVAALGVEADQSVADIGAGPGYFTLRLARAVGARGRVYAVEVVADLLGVLRRRIDEAGLGNVTPLIARDADSLLPPASCDRILIVDTFHHFPDGVAHLRQLTGALKPGGVLANVDFHRRETPVGPPLEHRVARDDFLVAADRAGLEVVEEKTFLPYQYFVLMRPR